MGLIIRRRPRHLTSRPATADIPDRITHLRRRLHRRIMAAITAVSGTADTITVAILVAATCPARTTEVTDAAEASAPNTTLPRARCAGECFFFEIVRCPGSLG